MFWLQTSILRTVFFIAVAVVCSAAPSFALIPFDDEYESPATLAMQFKKTPASWTSAKFGYFDGLITNNQTDVKHYDKRIGIGGGIGAEIPTGPNISFRLDLHGESVIRRQIDNASPETYIDERYVYVRPVADLTYITPAGLEIFGGASWSFFPAYSQKIESAYDSTSVKYGTTSILAPHVGVTRRGGIGAGGLYYQFGTQEKRGVTKTASDGTVLNISQTIHEPSTLGVFAMFNGLGAVWSADLAAVSEGDGGERTENGNTMRDDYLRLSIASTWNANTKVGLSYRSASYAKSAYMDLDSIPITALRVMWLWGAGVYSGVTAAYGRDRQSIPEVNARYDVNALSVMTGVSSAF